MRMEHKMKKSLRTMHLLSLSLGFISAIGLAFNVIMFILLYPKVMQFQPVDSVWETLGIVVGLNALIIALFHLSGVMTLLLHILRQKVASIIGVLAIVLGTISGLMILADLSMLGDIGKEYELGWDTSGEWTILFISYGLHAVFLVLALIRLIVNLEKAKGQQPRTVLKDEVLFLSLHNTGWICGGLGLLAILAAWLAKTPLWLLHEIVIILSSLILLPYVLVLGVWLFKQRKAKASEWLDEKQFQDLTRAGFWALVFSVPFMILLYLLEWNQATPGIWSVLWLPCILFIVLLLFSAGTLRFYSV